MGRANFSTQFFVGLFSWTSFFADVLPLCPAGSGKEKTELYKYTALSHIKEDIFLSAHAVRSASIDIRIYWKSV